MDKYIFPMIGKESELPIYITGVGIHENQLPINRPDGYLDYQFVYCVKGEGILLMNNKKYSFSAGTGVLIHSATPHEYSSITQPWETHWVSFRGSMAGNLLTTFGFPNSDIFFIKDTLKLSNQIYDMLTQSYTSNINTGYVNSGLIYKFLIELNEQLSKELSTHSVQLEQLAPVLNYIEENYDQIITLENLSDVISVSPQYFCKIFKKYIKMRPFEYITKKRIQNAKVMILEDNLLIKDIAFRTGFNDTSYFCSIFKKFENMSPDEFRKLHRNLK